MSPAMICRAVLRELGHARGDDDVTFKVLPRPEETARSCVRARGRDRGRGAVRRAMATPFEVSGAVHLQQALAARLWHGCLTRAQQKSVTAMRIENFSPFRCLSDGPAEGRARRPTARCTSSTMTARWRSGMSCGSSPSCSRATRRSGASRRRRDPARRSLPPSRAIWTAGVLRLVGRPGLGRGSCQPPMRAPPTSAASSLPWRACDAHARRAAGACSRRRVPAARAGLAEISRGIKAVFDPARHAQPRAHVC